MTQIVGGPPFGPAGDGVVYAKRQGAVATVFIDAVTGQCEPVSDFEQDTLGFPYTTSDGELRAMFPGRKVVFVDAPAAPLRLAQDALPADAMDKAISDVIGGKAVAIPNQGIPQNAQATSTQTSGGYAHPSPPVDLVYARTEEQFKLLLAKYSVASGKTKSKLKTEIENVASFIIKVIPGSESVLQRMKEQVIETRFKL